MKIYFKGVQRRLGYYNNWTFFAKRDGKEILLVDIQEILVDSENVLPFEINPNPYNPEHYDKVDARLKRQAKKDVRLSKLKVNLMRRQDGICPLCGTILILNEEDVERDHITPRAEGGADTFKNTALVHKTCHLKKTAFERKIRANKKRLDKMSLSSKSGESK